MHLYKRPQFDSRNLACVVWQRCIIIKQKFKFMKVFYIYRHLLKKNQNKETSTFIIFSIKYFDKANNIYCHAIYCETDVINLAPSGKNQ